jgi:hypothetical protein
VKLTTGVGVFTAGYVIGAKAGHERYAQIVAGMARASRTLEEFSARHPPARQDHGSGRADGDPRPHEELG